MTEDSGMRSEGRRPARLSRRDVLRGTAVVAAFLAADLGALVYANNWIGPVRLTPGVFLEGFAKVFGRHPGFRKNHAKGVAVTGYFESNGNGRALSKAAVFAPGRTPVTGRFSLAGGNPTPRTRRRPRAGSAWPSDFQADSSGGWRH
jgi:catalase